VTVGLTAAGRFPAREIPAYVAAQLVGAIVASLLLLMIARSMPGFDLGGFATNGYGDASPKGYPLVIALVVETVLTAAFLMVILGATDERSPAAFAPLAIGLALTLIHLLSIPVTNTSVNPARSTGPALVVGAPLSLSCGRSGSRRWSVPCSPVWSVAGCSRTPTMSGHPDPSRSPSWIAWWTR
jgi:aquaporin Z